MHDVQATATPVASIFKAAVANTTVKPADAPVNVTGNTADHRSIDRIALMQEDWCG